MYIHNSLISTHAPLVAQFTITSSVYIDKIICTFIGNYLPFHLAGFCVAVHVVLWPAMVKLTMGSLRTESQGSSWITPLGFRGKWFIELSWRWFHEYMPVLKCDWMCSSPCCLWHPSRPTPFSLANPFCVFALSFCLWFASDEVASGVATCVQASVNWVNCSLNSSPLCHCSGHWETETVLWVCT